MTRTAGQILILSEEEESLSALEFALVRLGANVVRSLPDGSAYLLEQVEPDVVLVDPKRIAGRAAALLDVAHRAPVIVALLHRVDNEALRWAMACGARDWLKAPISDPKQAAATVLEIVEARKRHGSQRRIREAESVHLLKQQVRELTERYVRQCRTFDEAQDVFYLDLSRMMTIFDNIMDGIVFTDPEGQVTLMNPVAEDLLGVKTIFAIGKRVRDFGRGTELIDEVARDHECALLDGGVTERTVEIHQKSHSLSYLELRTTAVIDYKGSFAGILSVIKDVTAEYKGEQMKNQYLSIVSHELRTPLTGIKTFATLMAKGTLGPLPGVQQEVIDTIREQTLRLEHQVDRLICLGRIESGDFAMDRESFELSALLDTLTAPFAQAARDRGIDFRVRRTEDNPCVRADREDLRRAIQALIANAIKFTPNGGHVEISIECPADGGVVVHVKDSGPGISPRYHGRIFEKFFQVEDPLTRQYGGAGLGLCVAQGVAKAHGGCIEVMSDLGQGAEFRFYLPVCDAARDVAADREDEKSQAALASIRKEE